MNNVKKLFNVSNSKLLILASIRSTGNGKMNSNLFCLFKIFTAFNGVLKISIGSLIVAAILSLNACNNKPAVGTVDVEKSKTELRMMESAFADSVAKYGFNKSVLLFAGEAAVLFNDGDTVLSNMDSVRARVSRIPLNAPPPPYTLTWKPDFVDVSTSGDMGYTYGFYILIQKDKEGKEQSKKGLYLSIWKKNTAGQWKLVVD